MAVDIADFTTALRQYAAGVCLLTVRDDLDDVGTTVTSVMSVSAEPPGLAPASAQSCCCPGVYCRWRCSAAPSPNGR